MDKAIIEPGDILGVAKDQLIVVSAFYHLVKEQTHLLCVGIAFFHVHFGPFEQFAEKSHMMFLQIFLFSPGETLPGT